MGELEEETIAADPIGSRLKAAREAQGMTLDDIAAKTRVPIRHLQHMERGEWDELPAPTYSVGFARAYANAVGLDGSEIGAQLRSELGSGRSVATPQYEPADPARVPPKQLVMIAIVIGLLLAGGYLLWRSGAVDDTGVDESQIAGIETPAGPAEPAALPPPSATASGPVVLTATNDVWLRVYEANGGSKLYENILKAGERFEVPSTAIRPVILTGRPDALQVTVGTIVIPPLGEPERTISDVSLLPADLLARARQTVPQPAAAQPAASTAARASASRAAASRPSPAPAASQPAATPPTQNVQPAEPVAQPAADNP